MTEKMSPTLTHQSQEKLGGFSRRGELSIFLLATGCRPWDQLRFRVRRPPRINLGNSPRTLQINYCLDYDRNVFEEKVAYSPRNESNSTLLANSAHSLGRAVSLDRTG